MINWTNILALTFITPAFFIAGLLLASIPIIIHILNRRRFRTVNWAAMEFLLRAMKKNRRRLKFEQWILLATRCLALLLVATALARPLGCEDRSLASIGTTRSGLHVFLIDNSYSMAYEADRPEARTHLDQAKKLAREQIARLSAGGESVAIVTLNRPAKAVLSAPTYDLTAAASAVGQIEQAYGATDVLGALRAAADIARTEKAQVRKHLYLITDGTRSAWQISQADALAQLGHDVSSAYQRIVHFNLGRRDQWNQAVLALRSDAKLVTNKFNSDFIATVQGFGSGPDPALQWRLGDSALPGGRTVKLTGEPQNLPHSAITFANSGPQLISLTLAGDDRLKIDNQRAHVVNVAGALKVLLVEGERGVGRFKGSGSFLATALAPPHENAQGVAGRAENYLAPEIISDLELGNKVFTDYRTVILTAVGQVPPTLADQLALFVRDGGTLMIFMGEPVAAQNYNEVLLSRGLLPGALVKRVNAAADQRGFTFDFNPSGNLHPLLKEFQGVVNSGLDTAQTTTYWQLDVKPQMQADRVLNYAGSGDPAVLVHALGQGRVVTVTTTAGPEWNTLPGKPAYPPLMHELLRGSVSSDDNWMNLQVGDELQVPASLKLTGSPVLIDAAQKEIVLESVPGGGAIAYKSAPITRPGVYRLTAGSSSLPIAVNVASEEADVRTLENGAIKKALGDIDIELESDQLPAETVMAGSIAEDFGWPLMLIGVCLVATECFMAMRFGHYRRAA